jgi:hypothetical protein
MVNKLVAFGDSFTWGHDLGDLSKTWGNLTAKHFNLEYKCIAEGGRSNDSIARHCFEYCNANNNIQNELIAVMWTYPIRHEIFLKIPYAYSDGPSNYFCISNWHSLSFNERIHSFELQQEDMAYWQKKYQIESITGIIDIARVLDSRFAYQHWHIMSLKNQLFLKNYFDSKSIPYVFLYSVEAALFYKSQRSESYIEALTKEILSGNTMSLAQGGFIEISNLKNFAKGKTNHPLEEAHEYFTEKHVIPLITASIPF